MTKKDIVEALSQFDDSDEIMIGETPFLYTTDFTRICGKGQMYMIYKCVLPPGHDGECYCGCKNLHFVPDESNAANEPRSDSK